MSAFRRLFGVVVAGMVCLLVLGGGAAVAASGSFGTGGEEGGQFIAPNGVAVDQESGDVYVADTVNERVERFGSAGEFLSAWGWGVTDGHSEALQTCTTSCFRGVYGPGAGELRLPEGVAVDNDLLSSSHGDVYVLDTANSRVERFDAEGHFLLMFGGEVNETTDGDVCAAGEACRAGTIGSGHGQLELGEGSAIAVSPTGVVYVGNVNRVEEFDASGAYAAEVPLAGIGSVGAVAATAGGDVYASGNELSGVREYNSAGVEQGAPRDASGNAGASPRGFISLGASGELFVADGSSTSVDHMLEFNAAGNQLESFDTTMGEGGEAGIAFAQGIGGLYVLDRHEAKVRVVSVPAAGPLLVAQSLGELQPTTAAIGVTLNAEGHATTYHVEYGTSISYGSSTSPTPLAGSAFEDEPVSMALSGLQPRTTYHYRVVASNSAGTLTGADETFTTLPPVLIDSESVSGVTSSSATLAAQINPLGRSTAYRLEYGSSTAYGSSVPVPDGSVGAGTSDVPVSALVEGLVASTTYHFRVVASNSLGVVDGADHAFTTQGGEAPVLPDGRAWEMVSPPEKRGFALDPLGNEANAVDVQAAADGDALTYGAQGPIDADPRGNRSSTPVQFIATRTAGGWSSLDIATPHEAVTGRFLNSEYLVFSPDLSVGLVEPEGFTPLSPQATERTPYRRESDGEYQPLVTAANVPPGTKFGELGENGLPCEHCVDTQFVGASPDLSHVVVSSAASLTEGVAQNPSLVNQNLFEWAGGSLRLVSVLPDGKAATEEGTSAKLGLTEAGGTNTRHAVSDDGSRLIWEVGAGGHLYLRDVGRGETVQLDAPEAGARGGGGRPTFAVASGDGSKVFFMDGSRLTTDATAGLERGNLYMCAIGEVAGKLVCRLKDLTVALHAGEPGGMPGTVIGASEDGRYAYFVANGVLAAGASPGDCKEAGAGGVCNLYVYDSVVGEVRFVAQLAAGDNHDWEAYNGQDLTELTAGVSPDGRYLAFMSQRSLTGYDNIDAHSGQPDVEVYLYDVSTGHLVCASCNPSGARPSGVFDGGSRNAGELLVDHEGNWAGHWLAGSIPGWTNTRQAESHYRSRYLSDSGRLFFNSPDALLGRDANGKEDVYEYEPAGVGTCTGGSGCVGLISSGTSGEESAFLDASESGDDVFFLTAAQLAPQDLDSALDVYDARVCTVGSPCLPGSGAASVPCVTADSCRAAQAPQPGVFGSPPSATFSGAGNLTPAVSKLAVKKKRVLTVAQKRAVALRKCRAKPRRKRAACEAQVRGRYRVGVKAKRSHAGVTTRKGSR